MSLKRLFIDTAKTLVRLLLPKRLAYKLRTWHRNRLHASFPSRNITQSYCGHELTIHIGDPTAEGWYGQPWPLAAMPEREVLSKRKLKPGACVFDIGSHYGIVALVLSRCVGPNGKVVAVEAVPYCAKEAQTNKELNSADNLTVVPAMMLDGSQPTEPSGFHDRSYEWTISGVRSLTMDQLAVEHGMPDVVYMDVDGFEHKVLSGAKSILQTKADWFVEVHINAGLESEGGSLEQVLSFFPQDRFELLIAPVGDGERYVPYDPASSIMNIRFNLLALSRQ